jgi:lipid-A-disaccharide synthase
MPVFGETLGLLRRRHAQLQAVIPAAPGLADTIRKLGKNWPVPVTVSEGDGDKYDAFAGSRAALACSGTVAIELAMARLPSVTVYKLNWLTALLYGPFVRGTFANLVNIMHKRRVVPELLQFDCTPEKIAAAAHTLLSSDAAQKEGLAAIAAWLGEGQFVPSERAAETVLQVVRDYKPS